MEMQEMIKQAQQMQQKISKIREEMAKKEVQSTAGGGMVKVTANGALEVIDISIDPSVVDSNEVGMLQDLIIAAVNEALRKAKEMMEEEMSKVTGGLKIPGLSGMM